MPRPQNRTIGNIGTVQSPPRFVGIDLGADTIKVVELSLANGSLFWSRRYIAEHGRRPHALLRDLLRSWEWDSVQGAAVTGRLARHVHLPLVPLKQAQAYGLRYGRPGLSASLISIGVHGFSVLELRPNGISVFRENSRCSQGTGNFLRQLVGRFSLTVEEAGELCAEVDEPAVLSSRCPVILKTDMTHLANKGVDRLRILAGLYDAVCENVLVLLKPGISPNPVALIGGVARARRIRGSMERLLQARGMTLLDLDPEEGRFVEALGCALVAAELPAAPPQIEALEAAAEPVPFEPLPPLASFQSQVLRLQPGASASRFPAKGELILGFDIGSTGSKAVAWCPASGEVCWEGYERTAGDPVRAAQTLARRFLENLNHRAAVTAVGVTGSGREIVGSLMTICFGKDAVFVLNEIAAHAAGALRSDPAVDTIFEIGGQDAKYIRLSDGRVVDCAMNEACSAGTGSFIEEQGRRFTCGGDVTRLAQAAMVAPFGVSLGQHCSVFMAEVIEEALAAGVEEKAVIAGLYDSIIQNYLNRVKGARSVGQVIYCQGMPFGSDALAAAVARQTGCRVVVPPNPGTVGALGIALLAGRELESEEGTSLDLRRFLEARIERRDSFICKSTSGCGGAGNRCRIDYITAGAAGERRRFTWGGGCSLHDRGTRKKKLPDRSPDPFREREDLSRELVWAKQQTRGNPVVAIADEFMLKGLFPFFATYVHELGFDLAIPGDADHDELRRGVQEGNVPFCAPMQLFHGLAGRMSDSDADFVFLPMMRQTPRSAGEPHSTTCPIVQGSPDILSWNLGAEAAQRIVSPVVEFGEDGLESAEFMNSCERLAAALGAGGEDWQRAHRAACRIQARFEEGCRRIGRRAMDFCREQGVVPVVVLGRPYTIYNNVLNSNVPSLLREQGAVAIPVDCYPVPAAVPAFERMYWGHGQRILRAAHQIRRSPGIYCVYCSNYSCGPDSFNLHFFSYIMEGRPYAVIETDGHAGDAGTKTRIEAFLYCVGQDREAGADSRPANDFAAVQIGHTGLGGVRRARGRVLLPWSGLTSEAAAAALRGSGIDAESLPPPDPESLRMGRRHTSGKECLPMCITLGNLLKYLDSKSHHGDPVTVFMPGTDGPCRFGVYNLLNRILLEKLGLKERVTLWSPKDGNYFEGFPAGLRTLIFAGCMAADLLYRGLLDARAGGESAAAADAVYARYRRNFLDLLREAARRNLSMGRSLWEVTNGQLFGITPLLAGAAKEFAAVREDTLRPTVLVVGEIYVRSDPAANDGIIGKLERRGMRCRLAPVYEWLEYCDYVSSRSLSCNPFSFNLSSRLQQRIQSLTYRVMGEMLGWPAMHPVQEALAAARPYLRDQLEGEAVLTLGHPIYEWRAGLIDGVVSVGPLECMPNKIAEALFFHVAEREGLPALTLSFNGEPLGTQSLDNFAFEVHARFRDTRDGRHRAGRSRPFLVDGMRNRLVEASGGELPERIAGQR